MATRGALVASLADIIRLYVDERLNAGEIARRYGAQRTSVTDLLRRHDVEIRGRGAPRGAHSGKRTAPAAASPLRRCLRCERQFHSHGPGNRVCGPCKGTEEWRCGATA